MAIRMTGSDGEDCAVPAGRGLRLAAVLHAVARGPLGSAMGKVGRVNDHKGTLEVTWVECPTFGEMVAVHRAWSDVGLESLSEHMLGERMLAKCDVDRWDVCGNAVFDVLAAEVPGDMTINPFRVL